MARLKVEVAGRAAADGDTSRISGDVENAAATMFRAIGSGAKSAKDAFADFAQSSSRPSTACGTENRRGVRRDEIKGSGGGRSDLRFVSMGRLLRPGGYVPPGRERHQRFHSRHACPPGNKRPARRNRPGGCGFPARVERWPVRAALVWSRVWHLPEGGLVPDVAQAPATGPSQAVRIVNAIDPAWRPTISPAAGEKTILNVPRNGSAVRELLR